jgi:Spy/CpxP family protein refolding chaperone
MWATLSLALVLGMSLGILLDRFVLDRNDSRTQRRHTDGSDRFLTKLERELDLSSEQKAQLEKVLSANRQKARDFWKQTRGSYAELREEFRQEIRTVLTPEQQKRFDEMMAEEDARRRERRNEGR